MNAMGAIAGAVLNSLWQSAALVFLIWAALKFAPPRVNAATRYVIWWIALAAILALPGVPHWTPRASATLPQSPPALSTTLPVQVAPPFVAQRDVPVTISQGPTAEWPLCALGVWAAVFVYRISRIVGSYAYIHGIKRRATSIPHPLTGGTRGARLLLSPEISSPIAAGFLHPVVVVPEALYNELTAGEMNCVVLHEVAHLVRYDDWANLAGRTLGAAIAFDPIAWWVLRQIERERESACDDWVVAHTGEAASYVESLLRIVELRMAPTDSALAAGIFGPRSRLRARIELLLRSDREFSPAATRRAVGAATVALAVLAAAGVMAPRWIAFAQRLQFEVVSLKRNTVNGGIDGRPRRSGDLVIMHNTQMWSMLFYAYHLRGAYQVVGYKDFPDDQRWFDLDARIGRDATEDEVRLMMQSMLEDRFKLKVHRETREIPEYQLSLGKGKPKLDPPVEGPTMTVTIEDRKVPTREGTCGGSLWNDGTHVTCHAATIDKLIAQLSGNLEAPVADQTGLTGTYDLHIHYVPEKRRIKNPDLELGPTIGQAVAELGLKLEKGKGPVEVLVIDHMEKPSEN